MYTTEKNRIVVFALFLVALVAFAFLYTPSDAHGRPANPQPTMAARR